MPGPDIDARLRLRRALSCAPVLATVFSIVIFALSGVLHPFELEEANSPERDFYHANAEALLQGKIPLDPYHPLLYSIVTAGTAKLLGIDTFIAGRLVSNLAAGACLLLVFRTLRGPFGRSAALLALVATAVNGHFLTTAVVVASDGLFLALSLAALGAGLRFHRRGHRRDVALCGLWFAFAVFTRYQAAVFGVVLVGIILHRAPATWRTRAGHIALFAAATLLALLPHFTLTSIGFGSPFYNENWKTLAWSLSGKDFYYYDTTTRADLAATLAEQPLGPLLNLLRNTATLVTSVLPQLLSPAMVIVASVGLLGAPRRARVLAVILFAVAYSASVCVAISPHVRYMVLLIPLGYALAFHGLRRLLRRTRARQLLRAAVVLLVLALAVANTARVLRRFAGRHPHGEIAAATFVAKTEAPGRALRVCGTSPFLARHVRPHAYVGLPCPDGPLREHAAYLDMLRTFVRENEIDLVIVGFLSIYDAPQALLDPTSAPAFLKVVFANEGAIVYRIDVTGLGPP